jgi:dTDP-4-dehydrorhamnose reductase
MTKYKGEQAFLESSKTGALVRTSWLYSTFGQNFVKTMMKLGKSREELGVIFDQVGTPTYAADLAHAILKIVEDKKKIEKTEIFHYSNEGVASWYDFSVAIMDIAGIDCHVKPLQTSEFPLPATRPFYSVMNKAKIKGFLNIEIPHWRLSLVGCIKKLNA